MERARRKLLNVAKSKHSARTAGSKTAGNGGPRGRDSRGSNSSSISKNSAHFHATSLPALKSTSIMSKLAMAKTRAMRSTGALRRRRDQRRKEKEAAANRASLEAILAHHMSPHQIPSKPHILPPANVSSSDSEVYNSGDDEPKEYRVQVVKLNEEMSRQAELSRTAVLRRSMASWRHKKLRAVWSQWYGVLRVRKLLLRMTARLKFKTVQRCLQSWNKWAHGQKIARLESKISDLSERKTNTVAVGTRDAQTEKQTQVGGSGLRWGMDDSLNLLLSKNMSNETTLWRDDSLEAIPDYGSPPLARGSPMSTDSLSPERHHHDDSLSDLGDDEIEMSPQMLSSEQQIYRFTNFPGKYRTQTTSTAETERKRPPSPHKHNRFLPNKTTPYGTEFALTDELVDDAISYLML